MMDYDGIHVHIDGINVYYGLLWKKWVTFLICGENYTTRVSRMVVRWCFSHLFGIVFGGCETWRKSCRTPRTGRRTRWVGLSCILIIGGWEESIIYTYIH